MKKTLPLVAILMLAGVAGAAPLQDDVDNGSFEEFTATGPAGWTVVDGLAGDSSNAFDGAQAVVLSLLSTDTFAGIAQSVPNDEDDLPIVPGAEYAFDFATELNAGEGTDAAANAIVVWRDVNGDELRKDVIALSPSSGYLAHSIVLQAPLPAPGELPVKTAEVQFTLELASKTDRNDVLLFVDAVAFGLAEPSLP